MLDVLELEKKWSKYHFRKQLPLYITSLLLVILAGSASYLYLYQPELITQLLIKQKTDVKPIAINEVQQKPVVTVAVEKVQDEVTQNVLKPSFTFLYNLEDQVINYNNAKLLAMASANQEKEKSVSTPAPVTKVPKKPKETTKKSTVRPKQQTPKRSTERPKQAAKTVKQSPPAKTQEKAVVTKPVITIETPADGEVQEEAQEEMLVKVHHDQVSTDELNSVIKRFNNQKKPALSLFIAKKYYELGNYKEAYNYALITNKLNPNIEESILIFSRSLVKLGQKEDAINTLQAYIKKSGSFKAKILLSDIEKGNFS